MSILNVSRGPPLGIICLKNGRGVFAKGTDWVGGGLGCKAGTNSGGDGHRQPSVYEWTIGLILLSQGSPPPLTSILWCWEGQLVPSGGGWREKGKQQHRGLCD